MARLRLARIVAARPGRVSVAAPVRAWLLCVCFLHDVAHAHEPRPPAPRPAKVVSVARKTYAATCTLKVSLVDQKTGSPLPGIVQVRDAEGDVVELAEVVNRGQGIEQKGPIHEWWVLAKPMEFTVPATAIEIRALSGLETELRRQKVDLTGQLQSSLRVPLARFYRARDHGHVAGNTHLHLMKLSKQQADRYLQEVPLTDGLEVVFLSYLERAGADLEYTSNKYGRRELEQLSHEHLHWGHGQEHRHNFGSHGEGYGHILLLDVPYIIQPVSIGPGITKAGADAPPLQEGIDEARRGGGKVIWAHNSFGFEDIPNWITGRVHANNIFDGSARGSYKDTYYRYLNLGLHVPFSTGTDWFIYDFSRAYVTTDRPITPKEWLDRLADGKSFITNGPLLEWTVQQKPVGSVIDISKPTTLTAHGRALSRTDFKRIEVVRNGRVLETAVCEKQGEHFVANVELSLPVDAPCWLALRTPPPPVKDDPQLQEPVNRNEFGELLFAHTSPIYVTLNGEGVFDSATAAELVAQMKSDWEKIQSQAVFSEPSQRNRVSQVYQEAIHVLEERLTERGK
jgi:hypothetical protein